MIIAFFGLQNHQLTMSATAIKEVLSSLDTIIDKSIIANDARGIFAFVYRRTTAEIAVAIENSEFEDNEKLHEFDVAFANYYLKAYHQFETGETCSLCW